jgi:hypothetical protein
VNKLVQQGASEDDLAHAPFESAIRVERKFMFACEVAQTKSGKIMAMRGVSNGIRAREMRNRDLNDRAIPAHSVDFFHGFHNVFQVLNHVVGVALLKPVVRQWPRQLIQVMANIWPGGIDDINVYCILSSLISTPEAQRFGFRNNFFLGCGHLSTLFFA